jgi:hypothetical protein
LCSDIVRKVMIALVDIVAFKRLNF